MTGAVRPAPLTAASAAAGSPYQADHRASIAISADLARSSSSAAAARLTGHPKTGLGG
jgi:hypothetical protein